MYTGSLLCSPEACSPFDETVSLCVSLSTYNNYFLGSHFAHTPMSTLGCPGELHDPLDSLLNLFLKPIPINLILVLIPIMILILLQALEILNSMPRPNAGLPLFTLPQQKHSRCRQAEAHEKVVLSQAILPRLCIILYIYIYIYTY